MHLRDVPNFPPRAAAALEKLGHGALEDAAALSDGELVKVKGVGVRAIELIREAHGKEGPTSLSDSGSTRDAEGAGAERSGDSEAPAPAPGFDLDESALRRLDAAITADLARRDLALHFLDKLAEKNALTPELTGLAFDLALAFEQAEERAAGAEVELHDGMTALYLGQSYRVQTRVRAGEKPPADYVAVMLVPVPA